MFKSIDLYSEPASLEETQRDAPTSEPVMSNSPVSANESDDEHSVHRKGDLAIEDKIEGQELAEVHQDISSCQKENNVITCHYIQVLKSRYQTVGLQKKSTN